MVAVRSGQGCLTLCGDKRDLWLPRFLSQVDAAATLFEQDLPKPIDEELRDPPSIHYHNCHAAALPSHANQKAAKKNQSKSQDASRKKRAANASNWPHASAKRPHLQ